jgi:hypothetical protein
VAKEGMMKKAELTKIKVEKAKRMRKRAGRRAVIAVKDPKDLRGAKGALLKSAAAAILEEEPSNSPTGEQRNPPIRITGDW